MNAIVLWLRSVLPADPFEFWIALSMLSGSTVISIYAVATCRTNTRLQERLDQTRARRQAEAQAAEQAIDALSGRPAAAVPQDHDDEHRAPVAHDSAPRTRSRQKTEPDTRLE